MWSKSAEGKESPQAPQVTAPDQLDAGATITRVRLYDTLTRSVRDFTPNEPGRVTMYTCGPTVYRPVHIGNLRTFIAADLFRRALELEGLDVRPLDRERPGRRRERFGAEPFFGVLAQEVADLRKDLRRRDRIHPSIV